MSCTLPVLSKCPTEKEIAHMPFWVRLASFKWHLAQKLMQKVKASVSTIVNWTGMVSQKLVVQLISRLIGGKKLAIFPHRIKKEGKRII